MAFDPAADRPQIVRATRSVDAACSLQKAVHPSNRSCQLRTDLLRRKAHTGQPHQSLFPDSAGPEIVSMQFLDPSQGSRCGLRAMAVGAKPICGVEQGVLSLLTALLHEPLLTMREPLLLEPGQGPSHKGLEVFQRWTVNQPLTAGPVYEVRARL